MPLMALRSTSQPTTRYGMQYSASSTGVGKLGSSFKMATRITAAMICLSIFFCFLFISVSPFARISARVFRGSFRPIPPVFHGK